MGKIKTFKGKTKLKNELKIKLSDIMKIQRFEMAIFENDDGFPADYRGSIKREKIIYEILSKTTEDVDKQNEIRRVISDGMWNTNDFTFKPICDKLRALGYVVIHE